MFGQAEEIMPGVGGSKKVQPKTKELLPLVTFRHLEGTDWTTDPAPSTSQRMKPIVRGCLQCMQQQYRRQTHKK